MYVILNIFWGLYLQPTVCIASATDNGLRSCPDDSRIYTDFGDHTCGIRVVGSEPDDLGIWSVQIKSLHDGHVSNVVSLW